MKLELPALPQAATGSLPAFGIPPQTNAPFAVPPAPGLPMQPLGPRLSARPGLPPPAAADQGQPDNFNGGAATE